MESWKIWKLYILTHKNPGCYIRLMSQIWSGLYSTVGRIVGQTVFLFDCDAAGWKIFWRKQIRHLPCCAKLYKDPNSKISPFNVAVQHVEGSQKILTVTLKWARSHTHTKYLRFLTVRGEYMLFNLFKNLNRRQTKKQNSLFFAVKGMYLQS